jgi:hypothetical protein
LASILGHVTLTTALLRETAWFFSRVRDKGADKAEEQEGDADDSDADAKDEDEGDDDKDSSGRARLLFLVSMVVATVRDGFLVLNRWGYAFAPDDGKEGDEEPQDRLSG